MFLAREGTTCLRSVLLKHTACQGWVPFPRNSFPRSAFPRSAIRRNSYPRSSIPRNPRIRSFPTSQASRLPSPLLPGDLPQRTAYGISRSLRESTGDSSAGSPTHGVLAHCHRPLDVQQSGGAGQSPAAAAVRYASTTPSTSTTPRFGNFWRACWRQLKPR